MWIPPHLSRWAHSLFSLRQTLACAYAIAVLEGLGREEIFWQQEGKENYFFQNCFFQTSFFSHMCQDKLVLVVCNCSGSCFWPGAPAQLMLWNCRGCMLPWRCGSSSPEPRHTAPSVLSPPKAAKSQMNAFHVLCTGCKGCNNGLF